MRSSVSSLGALRSCLLPPRIPKIEIPQPRTTADGPPATPRVPGATYHVTSRGDRREPIYRDDADRVAQLQVVGAAMGRFEAKVLAYCLMGKH